MLYFAAALLLNAVFTWAFIRLMIRLDRVEALDRAWRMRRRVNFRRRMKQIRQHHEARIAALTALAARPSLAPSRN